MILETTQLLNNALIVNSKSYAKNPIYRPTHLNHPCTLWAAKSMRNFDWLLDLGLALCREYTYRYRRAHKCQSIIESFANNIARTQMPDIGLTPFAKCMPDQYKVNDAVESYRNYYRGDKTRMAKWTGRPVPEWYIAENKETT